MMEKLISEEVDLLEVECEPLQMEESDNAQTNIGNYDTPSTSKKGKFI